MVKVLDNTLESVLLKLTAEEYKKMIDSWIFDEKEIDDYEFVFDKPVKATDLLKTF